MFEERKPVPEALARCRCDVRLCEWASSNDAPWNAEVGVRAAPRASGYTTDLPIERYWRDARLTKIFEGTSEIQLRIISDRVIGDR